MALDLIGKAVAGNFNKVIEGAKIGTNACKLDCIQAYTSEYNGDWSMVAEFIFDIGGTQYGKKMYISKKGATSEQDIGLDDTAIGRVNNLLLKAFGVSNPNFISILQSSPVEKDKIITKYNKDMTVDEYKPQMLVNVDVNVVMKKNDAGYFEIVWMFNPNDKEGIDDAVAKAKTVANVAAARPTSIGGNNRPSIGGGKRPSIKVG